MLPNYRGAFVVWNKGKISENFLEKPAIKAVKSLNDLNILCCNRSSCRGGSRALCCFIVRWRGLFCESTASEYAVGCTGSVGSETMEIFC